MLNIHIKEYYVILFLCNLNYGFSKEKIYVIVRDSSMSLSFILAKNEKVKHYIKIKIHKLIVLRFWIKNGVNPLYMGLADVH